MYATRRLRVIRLAFAIVLAYLIICYLPLWLILVIGVVLCFL